MAEKCTGSLCEDGKIYDERWTNGREWVVASHYCKRCGGTGIEPNNEESHAPQTL